MLEVFTLEQIRERWGEYQEDRCWRILKDGEWTIHLNLTDVPVNAPINVALGRVKDHMSFPEYLEAK